MIEIPPRAEETFIPVPLPFLRIRYIHIEIIKIE